MKWMSAMTLGSMVFSSGLALAQQGDPAQPERRQPTAIERQAGERQAGEREGSRREGRRANEQDEAFATCVAIGNAAEVEVSQFAAQRLKDEQVKQFAQQMIRDHQAMLEKLQPFGAREVSLKARPAADQPADINVRAGNAGQADVNVQVERNGQQPRAERREARAERRSGEPVDFIAIKREIAEQCVQTAQEELAAKPAGEVDRCYMAAQVFAHQHMLDELKVLERHASPELKETLSQASQTTEQHLQHAKEILKSLEGQHQTESPPTSGTTNR